MSPSAPTGREGKALPTILISLLIFSFSSCKKESPDNTLLMLAALMPSGQSGVRSYSVGGTVSGMGGTGLRLTNNGVDEIAVITNGSFTFPVAVADGRGYDVQPSVQPTGPDQTCTASGNTGTVSGADVTGVSVVCTYAFARVSLDSTGVQGNGFSNLPSISADGRYVAFQSTSSNLVAGDTNAVADVFVHDRQTGSTIRVSVDSYGVEGNNSSEWPSISADGRYVSFQSSATNLVAGDTNGVMDVFVHDLKTKVTGRVSISTTGVQGDAVSRFASISADGHYVSFDSAAVNLVAGDTNAATDVFVHDRQAATTERVSINSSGVQGNGASDGPSISADGRYIAFLSLAGNLVAGDTNVASDVFVHDRQTGATGRVSVSSGGVQGNGGSAYHLSISGDGRYVAFLSNATNLVAGDTNGFLDVFLHDRQTGSTIQVSVNSAGVQGNGNTAISPISSSADGRHVVFSSRASNLAAGDTNMASDIFVYDRQTGVTGRVSVSSGGVQGNGGSAYLSISADGRYIAFASLSDNLVPGDVNVMADVFVTPNL